MSKDLKAEWNILYREKLPQHARARKWPVWEDHCIARIVYDHVAGAKWDTVWTKPAIHNMSEDQLKKFIETAEALYKGDLDPVDLNNKSLRFRGKALHS